jgi:hypothetical protein
VCRVDDAERATIWDEKERTAAKTHPCSECRRTIAVGERYRHISTLSDSRWSRDYVCAHCTAAATWLSVTCGGYLLTEVLEELVEHWDEGYRSVPFARMIAGMRQRWHEGRDPVPTGVRAMATAMLQARVHPVVH